MELKERLLVQKSDLMPPRQRGRLRIKPLPQDKDRDIKENDDECFKVQKYGL